MGRNPLTARERIGILITASVGLLTSGVGLCLRECRHKEIAEMPSVQPPAVPAETFLRDSIEDSLKEHSHRRKKDPSKKSKKKTRAVRRKSEVSSPAVPRNFLNDTVSVRN